MKQLVKRFSASVALVLCLTILVLPEGARAQDFDADGVPDAVDLDDDGDGIADVNDGMLSLPGNLISGREFHGLVFPENYAVPNQTLNIAGPPGTNVIVSGQSYIISGDGILTVSTNKQHVIPGLNSDASVDVVADADVTVALLSYNVYSADAWTGVPSMVLGTDYTVIGHPTYLSSAWSQLLVAGVEDGTAVEIISRTGAVVDSFTVGSGDTYLYQRDGRIDLTGYSVHASKNVSVGAGSSCLNTGAGACDFVHEQLLPDSYLATEYLVPNLFQNFKTRIVPSVSSTEILVNGVSRGTFDKGSFYEIAGAGLHIETSKPSSVYIITLGGDPRNSGDPSFILLPGADKGVLASTFNVPVPSFTNQLVVVAATDTVEDIVLDGNAVASVWTPFSHDLARSYTEIELNAGTHRIESTSAFVSILYGAASYGSYGYVTSFGITPIGESTEVLAGVGFDIDQDGLFNHQDIDSDNDGILDSVEAQAGLSALQPHGVDDDMDGLDAAFDVDDSNPAQQHSIGLLLIDSDGDGIADAHDLDSDNDGIPDIVEAQPTIGYFSPNADDAVTLQNNRGLNSRFAGGITPVDTDQASTDGGSDQRLPDYLDSDSDNDGLPDVQEAGLTLGDLLTGANGLDDGRELLDDYSDTNGLVDDTQADNYADTDNDAATEGDLDYRDRDSDNDGIPDAIEGNVDTDGDGLPDFQDTDSDNDGLSDTAEAQVSGLDSDADGIDDLYDVDRTNGLDVNANGVDDAMEFAGSIDSDNDGVSDVVDPDSDNDGVPDSLEGGGQTPVDTDNDGVADYLDNDSDGDGINDGIEARVNDLDTDADNIDDLFDIDMTGGDDRNGNGVDDAAESTGGHDSDGDGLSDRIDTDSDNDGVPDVIEAGEGLDPADSDGDGAPDYIDTDSDNDGIDDVVETADDSDNDGIANLLDRDSDNDGLPDAVEQVAGIALTDSDTDGVANYLDTDSDGDGIGDAVEAQVSGHDADGDQIGDFFDVDKTQGEDSDNNGVDDAVQSAGVVDTDNDGLADFLDTDSDNDGISDALEAGSDAVVADTDADGIPDYLDTDSDNDGIHDTVEGSIDTDGDGIPDVRDTDSDADSIPDAIETGAGSSPADTDSDGTPDYLDTDSDNDGIADGIEADVPGVDTDGDGLPDVHDTDADNDGIPDVVEKGGDAQPLDTDSDGIADYRDTDSDNDGLPDSDEEIGLPVLTGIDSDHDGVDDALDADITGGEDLDGNGIDDTLRLSDADSDGKPDYLDTDTDNDGLPDSIEGGADHDGDAVPDVRDLDSDNDGTSDLLEAGGLDANGNGQVDAFMDTNADGLDDAIALAPLSVADTDNDRVPDYLDLDSDNDGIADLVESHRVAVDSDADGRVDQLLDANHDGFDDAMARTPITPPDTDKDGIPDFHDLDSDNDGLMDVVEGGAADLDGDGVLDVMADADADGIPDSADSTYTGGADVDKDGVDDGADTDFLNDADSDSDGIINGRDPDANGDGLADSSSSGEPVLSAALPDLDNNGVADVLEKADAEVVASSASAAGGCSIGNGSGQTNLSLLLWMVFAFLALLRRRKVATQG